MQIFQYHVLEVVVRYFDEQRCTAVDSLLDLIEDDDGTPSGLCLSFKTILAKNKYH